jgi:hypothetical protein
MVPVAEVVVDLVSLLLSLTPARELLSAVALVPEI